MGDSFWRKVEMLRMIPRNPRKITVAELHRGLVNSGHTVDRRTVERDLRQLPSGIPVRCDEQPRSAGWSWEPGTGDVLGPDLSIAEAVQIDLVSRYLRSLLPTQLAAALAPKLREAQATLRTLAPLRLARWRQRVAVIPDGPPLQVPEVRAPVLEAVHEALLQGRCLDVGYQSLGRGRSRAMTVHPLALVYQGSVGYLVARVWNYDDLRHLALHRMRTARVMDELVREPVDFDLQRHLVDEIQFDLPSGDRWRLQLRLEDWLAEHLTERPLSGDQQITPARDDRGGHLLQATVVGSERLVWWLRSHGSSVEVLRPAALRRRMAADAAELAGLYRDG